MTHNIISIMFIISIFTFFKIICKFNYKIEPVTFFGRLLGLSLFEIMRPEYAYILNTTIIDGLDSRIIRERFTMGEFVKSNSYSYQDKLSDNILRFVALLYKSDDPILKYMYTFRSFGEILMAITGNRKFLFFFPDYFQIFFIKDMVPENYRTMYLILGCIIKTMLEFIHHYKKSLDNNLPNFYFTLGK